MAHRIHRDSPGVAAGPQHGSRHIPGVIAVPDNLHAVDEDMVDPFGIGINPELVSGHVEAVVSRPACHCIAIKHDDIGMIARLDQPPVDQAGITSRALGHQIDGLF